MNTVFSNLSVVSNIKFENEPHLNRITQLNYRNFRVLKLEFVKRYKKNIDRVQVPFALCALPITALPPVPFVALCCPLLPFVTLCCPLLPFVALCCPLLPLLLFIGLYQYSLISIKIFIQTSLLKNLS